MSNKEKEINLDDDDFNFDEFDLGMDLDDDRPLTRIEKLDRIHKGFRQGVIDALKNPEIIASITSRAIPSSYGIDPQQAVLVGRELNEVKEQAQKEIEKISDELKRTVKNNSEELSKYLPRGTVERLKNWGDTLETDLPGTGYARTDPEDDFVNNRLADLLERQEANDQIRDEQNTKRELELEANDLAYKKESRIAISSIKASIDRLNNFNEQVTVKYQRRSLDLQLRQYFVAAQTLLAIKDNNQVTQDNLASLNKTIAKPEIVKMSEHEETRRRYGGSTGARSIFGGSGGIVERLRSNAGRRLRETVTDASNAASTILGVDPIGTASMMGGPNAAYGMGGNWAGELAVKHGLGLGAGFLRKRIEGSERGRNAGEKSRYFTQNFRRILEERFLQGEENQYQLDENGKPVRNRLHPLIGMVRDLIGDERGSRAVTTDNLNTLQEPHPFTKQTNRSINEVIPGLLARIHQEIFRLRTGEDTALLAYDYIDGSFGSASGLASKMSANLLAGADADRVKDRTNELIDLIDPEKTLSEEERKAVAVQLLKDNFNNRLGSQERMTDSSTFSQIDEDRRSHVTGLMDSYFNSGNPLEKRNEFSERFNDLLSGSNLTRDDVQSLVNLGHRNELEKSGVLKNGVIDHERLFELMIEYQEGDASSHLISSIQTARQEQLEEEAKAKEREGRWKDRLKRAGRFGKDVYKGNITGSDIKKNVSSYFSELGEEAKPIFNKDGRITSFVDTMGNTVHDVYNDLGERVNDLKDKATPHVEAAQGAVVSTYKEVKQSVTETLRSSGVLARKEQAQHTVEELTSVVTNYLSTLREHEITEDIIDKASRLVLNEDKSVKSVSELAEAISIEKLKERLRDSPEDSGMTGRVQSIRKRVSGYLKRLGIAQNAVSDEKAIETELQAEAIGDKVGQEFKPVGEQISDSIRDLKETLVNQYQETLDRERGPRVGSYEHQQSLIKEKQAKHSRPDRTQFKKEEGAGGILSLLGGALGFLKNIPGLGIVGSLAAAVPAVGTIVSALSGSAKLAVGLFKGVGKLAALIPGMGKLGALIGGTKIGGVAKTILTGPKPSTKAGWIKSGLKLGGKAALVGGKAAIKGGVFLAKALPLLFTPAGLGVAAGAAAVGAAAYGGYKLYKHLTRIKPTPMNKYRMAQYGISAENEKQFQKVLQVEEMLKPALMFNGQGMPKWDRQKVNWVEIAKVLDTDITDQETALNFQNWFVYRFGPVFNVWAAISKSQMDHVDFTKAEELKGEELKTFIEGIRFDTHDYRTDIQNPMSDEPIEIGGSEVKIMYQHLKDWADKRIDASVTGKQLGVLGGVHKFLTRGVVGLAIDAIKGKKGDESPVDEPKGIKSLFSLKNIARVITPMGLLDGMREAAKNALGFFVASKKATEVLNLNQITALQAIRFKLYGATEMIHSRVTNLFELEKEAFKDINYNRDKEARWEGSLDDILLSQAGAFGIADAKSDDGDAWKQWFNFRFLPVFVNYCNAIFKLTGEKDPFRGEPALTKIDRVEVAKFIIGTITTDEHDVAGGVWRIPHSPWPGIAINMDPTSIRNNVFFLESEVSEAVIREEQLKEKAAQSSEEGVDPSKVANQGSTQPRNVNAGGMTPNHSGGSVTVNSSGQVDPGYAMGGSHSTGGDLTIQEGEGGVVDQLPMASGTGYANYKDLIFAVGRMTGIDPILLAAMVANESSFRPRKNSDPGMTAAGLAQFTDSTWRDMMSRYAKKYGVAPGTTQSDPRASMLFTAEYIKQNLKSVKSKIKGRGFRPADAYLAHFLGAGGYGKVLSADPNTPVTQLVDSKTANSPSNRPNFYTDGGKGRPRTANEFIAHFNNKLTKAARDFKIIGPNETIGGDSQDLFLDQSQQNVAGQLDNPPQGYVTPKDPGVASSDEILANARRSMGGGSDIPISSTVYQQPTPTMATISGSAATPSLTPATPGTSQNQPMGSEPVKTGSNGSPIIPGLEKAKGNGGTATLVREPSDQDGTYGVLTLPDGTVFNTIELPWKDNERMKSCIPPGTYLCKIVQSPRFGSTYEVTGVPNRSAILFHSGNVAGESARGLKADSKGCILPGLGRGRLGNQKSVTRSKEAMALFLQRLGGKPFTLVVNGGPGAMAGAGLPAEMTGDLETQVPSMSTSSPVDMNFSTTNPFDSLMKQPASAVPEPADSGYSPTMDSSTDLYSNRSELEGFNNSSYMQASSPQSMNLMNVENHTKETARVLNEQLTIQTNILSVLETISGKLSNTNTGEADGEKDAATRSSDYYKSQRANATNTPKPAITYSKNV